MLGMVRSDEKARELAALGGKAHHGSLEDLDSVRKGAAASDAVIHLGFIHDFSKFQENCEIDKHAIEAIGSVLAGSKRPFIVTAGTAGLAGPGQVATEGRACVFRIELDSSDSNKKPKRSVLPRIMRLFVPFIIRSLRFGQSSEKALPGLSSCHERKHRISPKYWRSPHRENRSESHPCFGR